MDMEFKKLFDIDSVQEIYLKARLFEDKEKRDCLFFLIQFYFKRLAKYTNTPFNDSELLITSTTILSHSNELDDHILNWLHRLLILDSYHSRT
jgi:hypothetical protein